LRPKSYWSLKALKALKALTVERRTADGFGARNCWSTVCPIAAVSRRAAEHGLSWPFFLGLTRDSGRAEHGRQKLHKKRNGKHLLIPLL